MMSAGSWPSQGPYGNAPPSIYYPQAQGQSQPGAYPSPQQYQLQLQHDLMECERQLQVCYQQPQRTPEIMQRIEQLQQRVHLFRSRLMQVAQQQQHPGAYGPGGMPSTPQQPQGQMMPPNAQPGHSMPGSQVNSQPPGPQQFQPAPITSKYSSMMPQAQNAGPGQAQISPHQTMGPPSASPMQRQMSSMQVGPGSVPSQPPNMDMNKASEQTSVPSSGPVQTVMQTAASQVQVNITPEPTGRTLISVYHQYPAPNTITSTATAMPNMTAVPKDSIPPEPLPPKYSKSNELQSSHLQQSPLGMRYSAMSRPTEQQIMPVMMPRNSSATLDASFSASETENQNDLASASTTIATSATIAESLTTAATIDKPEEEEPLDVKKETQENQIHENDLMEQEEQQVDETENENIVEGYDPIRRTTPRGSIGSIPGDPNISMTPPTLEAVPALEVEETAEIEAAEELEGSPPEYQASENNDKNEFAESATTIVEDSVKAESQEDSVKSETIDTVETPAMEEKSEEKEENQDVESMDAAEAPSAESDDAKYSTPPVEEKKTAKSSSRKRSSNRKRARKTVNESDWDLDDNADIDFVVSKTKKRRGAKAVVNQTNAIDPDLETNLEGFIEKRRSGRKKAEKSYDLEKNMQYEEDADEDNNQQPLPDAKLLNEQQPEEWIVEKILGTRIVKRKKKKKLPVKISTDNSENHIEIKNEQAPTEGEQLNGVKHEVSEDSKADDVSSSEVREQPEKEELRLEEVKKEPSASTSSATENDTSAREESDEEEEVEEIYVKFKGRSYLHCEWKSLDELEALDKRVLSKFNRHKQKFGDFTTEDDDYFNEDYIIVDRVLDETYDDEENEHYAYVKWRSLPYDECTWELFKDVPDCKIEEFRQRINVVDPCKVKERSRPAPSEWQKIPLDITYKDDNSLRDYQVEGVNWLLFCYFNQQNCILADEMGLGKTVQTITFLQGIYDKGIHGPFLIVVPLSTLHNWEREFETWTDMNAVVYHGSAASRQTIQEYEMYYPNSKPDGKRKGVIQFDALITTFEMVVSDCEVLRKINYRVCVIDEAHRLKNRNCKLLTGGLLSFRMEHRVLLTGTPLQNNIQELFSLLNFLEPEQFCSSESFLEQFGQCQTEEQVQKLQEILKPMMLRRLKEDVEKTLQPKEETIIEVQLSNIQKKYYRAILERNFTHLLKGSSQPSLMNTMMELRKCCNHPFLINGAEEQILQEVKLLNPGKTEEEIQLHGLIHSSGKVVLIDKLLPKLRQDGHKVLIFSQMVRVLDLLEEFLNNMNYPFERIDGNVRGDLRQAAIDRFCKQDSERFVFLLCTRAGGLGINLTAADTVIIFDSDWNPQNDLQAQARCHRIGQTKMVKVYRLITSNTYEREMFDKASLKLGLDKAVLQNMGPKDTNNQLSRKEVEDLLRKGAYGAVMDEDNEGSKFSEEDIDTIMQRRTQTIRLEPGVKGSTFAKASFTSSHNREDIDVNDPNFWSKWAKKANIDVDAALDATNEHLIVSHPRSRRKRFEENYKASESGEEENGSEEGEDKAGQKGLDKGLNRSGKKRRRGADYTPNELAFNKTEYFKVEKLLGQWGWGRWKTIKEKTDVTLSENDMEHISRTFLLHCIRVYRGDEKTRDFVWSLIIPQGGAVGKNCKKGAPVSGTIYREGWASLPEYNPPAFAVDLSFERHIHRHANKLLMRIYQICVLQKYLGEKATAIVEEEKPHTEIQIELPALTEPPLPNWDQDCDKSLLIGVFRHGIENYDAIRADPKLCFVEKNFEEPPSTAELNVRFKRLIQMIQRQTDLAEKVTKWPKLEEDEFMRILRTYGVKDDTSSTNVINWTRFRELSTHLHEKTDSEMLEQLYCVLAMCTRQQGGDLSPMDQQRADRVELISSKRAEKLMNRLHLMRKIHAIITTGIHNVRPSLKHCAMDVMPSGWSETHDEHLLVIVDKFGLDDITRKLKQLEPFQKMSGVEDKVLLRRVVEICTTLETGKWNGVANIEMVEDDDDIPNSSLPLAKKSGAQAVVAASSRSSSGRSSPMNSARRGAGGVRAGGRMSIMGKSRGTPTAAAQAKSGGTATVNVGQPLDLAELEKEKMRNLMHHSFLQKLEQTASSMNPNYILSMLGLAPTPSTSNTPGASKSSNNKQLSSQAAMEQQLQQMQALLTVSSLTGLPMSALASTSTTNTKPSSMNASEDVLNLSKKSASATTNKPQASKPSAVTVSTSAGQTASLSSGLSMSAINKLNQLSMAELLALSSFSQDASISVINSESGIRLNGDKAPKLKNLDQWLATHPNWTVDVFALTGLTPGSAVQSTSAAPAQKSVKETATSKASVTENRVSPAISKSAGSASPAPNTLKTSKTTTATSKAAVSSARADQTSTDGQKPSTSAKTDTSELEKQVQSTYATHVKPFVPESHHHRLGGEPTGPAPASTPPTSIQTTSRMAPPSSVNTSSSSSSAALSAAALSQLLSNPLANNSASAALLNSQLLAATASSNAASMMSAQNLEALQMQMLLQQVMLTPSFMGTTSASYNPTSAAYAAALMGTAGLGTSNAQAFSDSALAAAILGMTDPSALAGLGQPPKSTGSGANTQTSASTASNQATSNNLAANNNNNMAANLLAAAANEAALTAEIMANPTLLASMLNPMAAMTQPFGSALDSAQLNAVLGALSSTGFTMPTPSTSSSAAGLRASVTPDTRATPETSSTQSASHRKSGSSKSGKLNAVLEKLSGSGKDNPSPNPNNGPGASS
ncbi:chromo (CHRromatin organization MOdifier) domain-containing protein [Ditylenchus destructor]|nr:chromo (CHRromatin organization MOdifier) domain-containing protein [Ditylenchus destructor]